VRFGVRTPDGLAQLVAELGASVAAGSASAAAEFGGTVVFAGPFGAWPDFAAANAAAPADKAVIDAANPYPARDGAVAEAATASGRGSALYVARLLPGARIVKGFNTIYWTDLRDKAHSARPKLAMPIAGDDEAAISLASQLASDAGFDPVVVGGLDRSAALDPGSRIYAKSFTAQQVREALGLAG
jgi:predicted dinucleotide-binding enzyme